MKNKKLLFALTGLTIMPSIIMPLTTSCSKEESSKNTITLVGEAEQTLDKSTVATYKFKLENALSDGEQLSCEATNVVSSRGVMVEVADHIDIEAGKTDFSLEVTITTEGELFNNDSVNFDLVFKGQKKSKQTFTSEVKGLKITYIDDAKVIPLDKLVIKDGVLYGLNCTWDDPEIAECDTIFIPNNVVEICQDQYHVAKTGLSVLPDDKGIIEGPEIKTIKFEKGSKPLFVNNFVFQTADYVETIIFPKRLSYIGHDCFKNYKCLKTIDISSWDGEKFANDNPFGEQNIFVNLPDSAEGCKIILCGENSINADAYYTFTAVNEKFASWEGIAEIKPQKTGLKQDGFVYDVYDEKLIITDIEDHNITELVIPSWCNAIKPLAFVNALGQTSLQNLISISISSEDPQLEKIYAGAFAGTTAPSVDLESAINLKHLDNGVFYDSSIQSVELPNSLETISANCFGKCSDLLKLDLSTTKVTKISFGTFYECFGLQDVNLNPDVTWIGAYAFYHCAALETQFNFETTYAHVAYVGASAFSHCAKSQFIFPKDDKSVLSYLGQQAFENTMVDTSKTVDIYLPASIEYICDGAFSYNPGIERIEVSKNNKKYRAENGYLYNLDNELLFVARSASEAPTNIETIRPLAVAGMELITGELDLSTTAIKTIGDSAFSGAYYSTGYEIVLPTSVTSIGPKAFADSKDDKKPGVKSINLGELNNLTNLGEACFSSCQLLTDVTLPLGLTEIKSQCFMDSGVEKVKIPNSISKLKAYAFQSCELEWIDLHTYEDVPENWAEPMAFGSIEAKSGQITVYIKDASLLTYWKEQFTTGSADLSKLNFVVGEPE